MNYNSEIVLNNRKISINSPTYFIADVASNHDSELSRAKELIWLCKESGADAVKFQHFKAEKIVSDWGFSNLEKKSGHQADWSKSVFDTYKEFEVQRNWNLELIEEAKKAGIEFFTTPYDVEAIEQLDSYVPAYKVGSGDITWTDFIESIAKRNKPTLLATGASSIEDVQRAVNSVLKYNPQLVLMQCNTNYTGDKENFRHINLNVLRTYAVMYPNLVLGLSDHTPGHSSVLGAITLGARVVEKHFTDDNSRVGPDHKFSMNPSTWREMIKRSRELEHAFGDGVKRIEKNEEETVILQQRSIYLKREITKGKSLSLEDIEILRPALPNTFLPYELKEIIGKKIVNSRSIGEVLFKGDIEC